MIVDEDEDEDRGNVIREVKEEESDDGGEEAVDEGTLKTVDGMEDEEIVSKMPNFHSQNFII